MLSNTEQRKWVFGLGSTVNLAADQQFALEILVTNSLLTLKDLGVSLTDTAIADGLEALIGILFTDTDPATVDVYMGRVYLEADRQFKQFPIQSD